MHNVVFLKVLLLILMFNELIVDSDEKICPKGQKVAFRKDACEPCPKGSYQPTESDSKYCKPCKICNDETGSMLKEDCTAVTNTKCQCRVGFVPWAPDSSDCKCDNGFEQKPGAKVCSECEDGHFRFGSQKLCKRWKDCISAGVKHNGTKTSDVICDDELLKSNAPVQTSTIIVSLLRTTTHRPPEGAQTLKMQTTTKTAAVPPTTSRQKVQPSNTVNHNGVVLPVLLIIGFFGLLVLTAMTFKLHSIPCCGKKTTVPKQDSFCGRPVEESGDDSSSSLKLNPGEP